MTYVVRLELSSRKRSYVARRGTTYEGTSTFVRKYFRKYESTSVQRVNKRVPLLTYLYVYPITTHNRHNPYMSAVQTTFCEAFSNFRAYSSYGSTSRRIYVNYVVLA